MQSPLTLRPFGTASHKLSEVQSAGRVVAQAFGGQLQVRSCTSDVQVRYTIYRDSLVSGMITRQEFNDLVSDIPQLAHVDHAGCSVEFRAELQKALDAISKAASVAASL